MRIWLAWRVFFAVLFDARVAERVSRALAGEGPPAGEREPKTIEPEPSAAAVAAAVVARPATKPVTVKPPGRNDALTLLATLQREARLLDLVQEPLGGYSDAQVGAAARDVLSNCAAVMERLFALRPVRAEEEGSDVEVPNGYDPLRIRLVGNVAGAPPYRGKLMHHGWVATRCELPAWSGSAEAATVVAPVEVEIG